MKYYKKIVGDKVYLSPVSLEDVETFMDWVNDEEIGMYTTFLRQTISFAKEKSIVDKLAMDNNFFSIIDKASDKLIGNCSFMSEDMVNRTAEIGIVIGERDYWSKGFGSEAIKLLLDYGFRVRNHNSITLKVHGNNKRAIKCYKKVGFKHSGVKREALIFGDKKVDILYMDILAAEHKTNYLDKYFN